MQRFSGLRTKLFRDNEHLLWIGFDGFLDEGFGQQGVALYRCMWMPIYERKC